MTTSSAQEIEQQLTKLILDLNPQFGSHGPLATSGDASESLPDYVAENSCSAIGAAQDLFRQLDARPPLPAPVSPTFRARLIRFYERYNRQKLATVAQVLRQYAGHEPALFAALVQQYGPEPQPGDEDFAALLRPLPKGWACVESTRGDIYYRHTDGRCQWHRPR